ncbi:MAG: ABC transporter substrate-binding protein [Halodesulfurarchaeum sp.]
MPDKSISRRRFLQATGGVAAATALAGCGGDDDDGGTTTEDPGTTEVPEEPDLEGTYLQRINSTLTTIDPIESTDEASSFVITQVFDNLTHLQQGEINLIGKLAEDWELSEDYRTITFHLTDATYHNGETMTASDVVYAFERLAASSNSRRSTFILDYLNPVHETETVEEDDEEVEQYVPESMETEAVDDSTFEITLEEPFHSSLEMVAYNSFAVYPEGIVGDIDGYDGEMDQSTFATENPIGAGPFEFGHWTQGTEARVERFDDYHGEVANIDGVHWRIIEDDDAAYNYAMNKNADAFGIPTAKYDPDKVNVEETDDLGRMRGTYGPLRNDETAEYLGVSELTTYYLGFNMEVIPKPVRKAFAYATDQQLIVEDVFKERGSPAYHLTPPGLYPGGATAYDEHAEEYPYGPGSDLESARQVMEDADYGEDERFSLTMTSYESNDFEEMLQIIRDQLESVHIDMTIEPTQFSTITQRGRQGDLEAYTLGWGPDWPEADNFLQFAYPPNTDTSESDPIVYINWSEETGDAAGDATEAWETVQDNPAPTEEHQQARNEAYRTLEEAMWEDVPFTYLYHPLGELFSYDWLDMDPYGSMGPSWQKYNQVSIGDRD